jgi:hypothetical protein
MDQLRLLTLKHELLKISVRLQTAKWLEEQGNIVKLRTYVPRRNMNADCFENRGATFSATEDIYH